MALKTRISPCLWFDGEGERAAQRYTSIFPNSEIRRVTRYTEEGFEFHKRPAGSVMTVEFVLDGLLFVALNGGPQFKFNESISLQIFCETQDEIDHYWSELSDGGEEGPCGWLKDRFGLSWQVAPTRLNDMVADPDPRKAQRVTHAFMRMKKFDLAALERAYAGE